MIVANMATYPERAEALRQTLPRIAPQVGQLNLVLNDYGSVPSWLDDFKTVVPILPETDLKDVGKFLVPPSSDAELLCLLDDDLLYPPDYVEISVKHIRDMPGSGGVFGYHYSIYKKPDPLETQRPYEREVAHFGRPMRNYRYVDQLGTGCSFLKPDHFPPMDYMKGSEKFVDVRFARWCFEEGIDQISLPRDKQWIKQGDINSSIFETFTLTFPDHVDAEILSFAFKRPLAEMQDHPAT